MSRLRSFLSDEATSPFRSSFFDSSSRGFRRTGPRGNRAPAALTTLTKPFQIKKPRVDLGARSVEAPGAPRRERASWDDLRRDKFAGSFAKLIEPGFSSFLERVCGVKNARRRVANGRSRHGRKVSPRVHRYGARNSENQAEPVASSAFPEAQRFSPTPP